MYQQAKVGKLVKMNSGVLYFKRNRVAKAFFNTAKKFFRDLGNFANYIHRGLGPADEPYFAIAFGAEGLNPFPIHDKDGCGWMISTIGSTEHQLDAFSGTPPFIKGATVSPTISHFIGLAPVAIYEKLCVQFLEAAEIDC